MPTAPRTVTGNVATLTGTARAGVAITFTKQNVADISGQYGKAVLNEPVVANTNELGVFSITLYPGTYTVTAAGSNGPKRAVMELTELGSTDFADLIDQASMPITSTEVADARAARDKAEEWADAPRDEEVEPDKFSARHWAEIADERANTFDAQALAAAVESAAADREQTGLDRTATGLDVTAAAGSASAAAGSASTASTQAGLATTARIAAEAARDSSFANAKGAATIADARALVADNETFIVYAAGATEFTAYRRTSSSTQVLLGTYPAALRVADHRRRLTNIITATANLFDKDDPECADNFFVNHLTGNLGANDNYFASGFVPVVGGETYYLSSKTFIAWYNSARGFISGSSNTDTNPIQTAPAGAAFLRFSLLAADGPGAAATAYVVLGSTPPVAYEPYGGKLVAPSSRLPQNWIAPLNTTFLDRGKNLFDKSARTISAVQSTGGVVGNADHDLSDYIAVEEGVTYQYRSAVGGARFRACFNATLQNVSDEASAVESSSYTVPIGSGVRFMRLSIAKARVDGFLVEAAAAPTAFEAYGYRFKQDILPQEIPGLISNWSGKKTSSFGDSLTAQQQWQPAIATELGLLHTAYGVGGRLISGASGMCQDAAVNTLPSDSDLVLVLGGTNDWAQSVVLGVPSSTNTEEFYGALNQMCEKLTTRLPTAVICLLTTPYGELPGRVTDLIWATAHTNNAGLTTRDYAEAIRVAGKRWGMPVIDLSDCGWNSINLTNFMQNDGGWIHPNATGGERMARVAIGRLKALEPTT
jgi:hypothetical protein